MKRDEWIFQYPKKNLIEALEAKIEYHEKRLDYWQKEHDEHKALIMEKGIELKEHEITGGSRLEAVVDESLAKRYEEAQGKLWDHERKLEEYQRYYRAISSDTMVNTYPLDIRDVEFFGL